MNMEISVIVCTKNEEKYLPACLDALKNQVLKAEIIIIDGHSTDKTIEIAKKYTNRIFSDSGTGLADARNMGWQKAGSPIVAYCDADATPSREWTKNIVELLKKYDVVSGPFSPYDGGYKQKFGLKVWADIAPRLASQIGYNSVWGANMAFKKSVLEKQPFKAKFLEDYEIGRRIRRAGYKVKFTNKINIKASSRRFAKSFHRLCFREYIINAIRIKRGKDPRIDYWKNK